jgi:hypothetical protein
MFKILPNRKIEILIGLLLTSALLIMSITFAETTKQAPKVPFKHMTGMQKYQNMCSTCHGQWIGGSQQGPPLLHPFYKPSHHADATFYRAALRGVKAHHWEFGDMPPVKGATKEDLDAIVPFVRWLQREKGLYK